MDQYDFFDADTGMLFKSTFTVISLLATARAVKIPPLSIVDEARNFIDTVNNSIKGRIDTWGYSDDYDFWKGKHNTKNESVITGKVDSLMCISTPKKPQSETIVEANACEEVFEWYIGDGGLETPFDLPVNVTVSMISEKRRRGTVLIKLNNQTTIKEKLRSKHHTGKVRKIRRMCPITANITFEGYFAFHYSKVYNEDMSRYRPISVTRLNNTSKGLHKKRKSLVYELKGIYKEILCRKVNTKET